jgi:hypothetical protein
VSAAVHLGGHLTKHDGDLDVFTGYEAVANDLVVKGWP